MRRLITAENRAAARALYIPKGSIKVSDRSSDAVVYLSENDSPRALTRKYRATVFFGTQSRPVFDYGFGNLAARERFVREKFAQRQERAQYMATRRTDPSATANRNRDIKRVLEAKFGRGKVRVTGDRGTAYGWVRVTITAPAPGDRAEVIRLITDAGIRLGYYDSADYGSGHEIVVNWERQA